MVTIVKQPRFSLWRLQEIYQFPLPPGNRKPIERILAFYRAGPLKNIVVEPDGLGFNRGNIWHAFWFANHPRARQKVFVRIVDGIVTCEFHFAMGLASVRV